MEIHTCPTCGGRIKDAEKHCEYCKPTTERGSLLTTLVLLTVITVVIAVLGI